MNRSRHALRRDTRRTRVGSVTRVLLTLGLVALMSVAPQTFAPTAVAVGSSFTFGMVGDQGADPNAQAVMTAIGAKKLDFFQNVGDLAYAQIPTPDWCALVKSKISVPFLIVAGNHESRETSHFSAIEDYVKPGCLPNPLGAALKESPLIDNQPAGTTNYAKEYYYDFPTAAPLARMIVLSPNENWNLNGGQAYDYSVGSLHYQWVAQAIDEAKAKGEWVIVAFHEPYINTGGHGNQPQPSHDLFNLLVKKNVDVIFSGHDHNYQRSKQFALSAGCNDIIADIFNPACVTHKGSSSDPYIAGAGPVAIVAGMGGGDRYDIVPTDPDYQYFQVTMGKASPNFSFGFIQFDVTPTGIKGTFVDATKGGFTDSFTIKGSPPAAMTPTASPTSTGSSPATVSASPSATATPLVVAPNTLSGSATIGVELPAGSAPSKVEYFANTTKIGEATTSPYSITWNTTETSNGNYALTVRVTNSNGTQVTGPGAVVAVMNGAWSPWLWAGIGAIAVCLAAAGFLLWRRMRPRSSKKPSRAL